MAKNRITMNFKVSESADVDIKNKWGELAHISEEDRQKIFEAGHGEMGRAIKYIRATLNQYKKNKNKRGK